MRAQEASSSAAAAPQYPAGPFVPEIRYEPGRRDELIAEIEQAPAALRAALAGLTAPQLEARYRNWTVRQIAHHIADSHLNGYARHKLAVTEDRPAIKPYNEGQWVTLKDGRTAPLDATVALMEGLHARWVIFLRSLTAEQFARTYLHPEYKTEVTLFESMSNYAWHGRHHTAQIRWVRRHRLGLDG